MASKKCLAPAFRLLLTGYFLLPSASPTRSHTRDPFLWVNHKMVNRPAQANLREGC